MTEQLKRLEHLTKQMLDYPDGYKIRDVLILADGKGISFCLKHTNEVAVADTTLKEGCVIDNHCHNVIEILMVTKGELRYISERRDVILTLGDSVKTQVGEYHKIEALVESELIAVSIPACNSYPE